MHRFLCDDAGAVTVDWVGLAAAVLLLGIMTIYAVFNQGVSSLVLNVNDTLANLSLDVSVGAAPNLNQMTLTDTSGTPAGTGGSQNDQSTPQRREEGDEN